MRFIRRIVGSCMLLSLVFYLGTVAADKQELQENVIRLHVVADSDSQQDQQVKLQVRDALTAYLQPVLDQLPDMDTARAYLETRLPELEQLANDVLKAAGQTATAAVSLTKEAFSKRDYDTFSLPSGIYEALRVTIGSGEGKNWWCVMYPPMCHEVAIGKSVAYTGEETRLIYGGRYAVKFKLLELAASLAK